MVAALYRRYRPENFAEVIGQSQVTDPLRTALRSDRVNHAYLFSGPRGCGKTTSARILARCLNCVEGPTDTPCGVCPSCIELSRDGGGSMDVVEIDAASHGGVDDARDLRERAIFAPSRDRYKIFILDEAHMVTSGGFNALLKIVEEPPEHVKFIFATTEPDKVIGTIRSRTHHYPFRLVPPAQMLEYVHQLSESEHVSVEPGVLPLVVRAGGGSVRDTLSLLDQLIAGSDGPTVQYERAVALLGYTHATLLNEVVDALGARDAAAAFQAVDRVIQTGQDPRRFVEDLLERLRDLIVVSAVTFRRGSSNGSTDAAAAVLRGVQREELDHMAQQAATFGSAELSRAADVSNAALTEMTGTTSPRLHLELMIARILIPASDDTERGALVRVERLERRVGIEGTGIEGTGVEGTGIEGTGIGATGGEATRIGTTGGHAASSSAPASTRAPATSAPGTVASVPGSDSSERIGGRPSEPVQPASVAEVHQGAAASAPVVPVEPPQPTSVDEVAPLSVGTKPAGDSGPETPDAGSEVAAEAPSSVTPAVTFPPLDEQSAQAAPAPSEQPGAPRTVSVQQFRDAWPEVLEQVEKMQRNAWLIVFNSRVLAFSDDVLRLSFVSESDAEKFRSQQGNGDSVSEILRQAIISVLGVRVKFVPRVEQSRVDQQKAEQQRGASAPSPSPTSAGADDRGPSSTASSAAASAATPSDAAASAPASAPRTGSAAARPSGQQPPAARGGGSRRPGSAPATPPTTTWATVTVPDSEPIDEADREPEPEFEPDDSPIVAADQTPVGAGAPRSQYVTSESWAIAEPATESADATAEAARSAGVTSDRASSQPTTSQPPTAQSTAAPQPAAAPQSTASTLPPRPERSRPAPASGADKRRYGESVVREILGANFIEELTVAPRVTPRSTPGGE